MRDAPWKRKTKNAPARTAILARGRHSRKLYEIKPYISIAWIPAERKKKL